MIYCCVQGQSFHSEGSIRGWWVNVALFRCLLQGRWHLPMFRKPWQGQRCQSRAKQRLQFEKLKKGENATLLHRSAPRQWFSVESSHSEEAQRGSWRCNFLQAKWHVKLNQIFIIVIEQHKEGRVDTIKKYNRYIKVLVIITLKAKIFKNESIYKNKNTVSF